MAKRDENECKFGWKYEARGSTIHEIIRYENVVDLWKLIVWYWSLLISIHYNLVKHGQSKPEKENYMQLKLCRNSRFLYECQKFDNGPQSKKLPKAPIDQYCPWPTQTQLNTF